MDLTDIQIKQTAFLIEMDWATDKSPLEALALIGEELGELVEEIDPANKAALTKIAQMMTTFKNLTHEFRKKGGYNKQNTGLELADIILRTVGLASQLHINLDQFVVEKLTYNLQNIEKYKTKDRVM